MQGEFSYDTNKLELVNPNKPLKIADDTKWFNLGENLNVEVIHNSSDTEKTADIVEVTFKVKDTAETGTKAKVTITDLVLDSEAATNSMKQIGTKEVEVSIVEKQSERYPKLENPQEITVVQGTTDDNKHLQKLKMMVQKQIKQCLRQD